MTRLLKKPLLEANCDAKGKWLPRRHLPGQSYIQHPDSGFYRVIHNHKKLYNVGVSLLGKKGHIEVSNITDISFDVRISLEGTPADMPFYMSLSEAQGG